MGDSLYIFCGQTDNGSYLSSIEKLVSAGAKNIKSGDRFQEINLHDSFLSRQTPVVSRLNQREFVIMGGHQSGEFRTEVWLLDTKTDSS